MDQNYKQLHQAADQLHFKFKDICDDRSTTLAKELERATKQVVEDMESSRSPRVLENRIQEVQHRLHSLKAETGVTMTPHDAETLFRGYEELRRHIRGLSNY